MSDHDCTKFDCIRPCWLASGHGLSCFRAFLGLPILGAVLPPGKDQTLVDVFQRLVLCPCRNGAKTDLTSNEETLCDNDDYLPFKFGLRYGFKYNVNIYKFWSL